jgi:hypothetical protein
MLSIFRDLREPTCVGILEGICSGCEGTIDDGKKVLVESLGLGKGGQILLGAEVVIGADNGIVASTAALKPCRVLRVGTGSR